MKKVRIKFQEEITKSQLINVCKILHPTLTEDQLDKIKWHNHYCWVCVEFKVKDYGYIHFAIDPHSTKSSIWGHITMDRAKDIVKENVCFRVWRIVNDFLFEKDKDSDELKFIQSKQYIENIHPKPSAEEYYNYYMKD